MSDRYDGVRRYHAKRPIQTARRITEALERMRAGSTLRLPAGFRWTKGSLAKEAGVNVNTLLKKKDGKFVYAEQLYAFEQGEAPAENTTLTKARLRIAELEAAVRRLQRELLDRERVIDSLRKG